MSNDDKITALLRDIHDAIGELAGGSRYPDLTDAINELAALAATHQQPALQVGDAIAVNVRQPHPATIRMTLATPESVAYANELLADPSSGWSIDTAATYLEGEPAQAPVLSEADERAAFDSWAKSRTGQFFSPGVGSISAPFYYHIWSSAVRWALSTNPKSEPVAASNARTPDSLAIATAALETLAKLGNGERAGNSIGNLIAQEALAAIAKATAAAHEPAETMDQAHARVQSENRRYGPLIRAAIALLADVDERFKHEPPLKYTIPYGAVNALRESLSGVEQPAASDRDARDAALFDFLARCGDFRAGTVPSIPHDYELVLEDIGGLIKGSDLRDCVKAAMIAAAAKEAK